MRNPLLVGERVYLRPLELSDAPVQAYVDHLEPDAEMYAFGRLPLSPLDYDVFNRVGEHTPPDEVVLAICLRETDEYIGEVSIEALDWVNRTGETGSYLRPDGPYRGYGFGTEAKLLLLRYCFEQLGLHVIQSRVFEKNVRSSAALRKQGYQPAGRMKWRSTKGGVYYDNLLFDITRDEWRAARADPRARGGHRRSAQ